MMCMSVWTASSCNLHMLFWLMHKWKCNANAVDLLQVEFLAELKHILIHTGAGKASAVLTSHHFKPRISSMATEEVFLELRYKIWHHFTICHSPLSLSLVRSQSIPPQLMHFCTARFCSRRWLAHRIRVSQIRHVIIIFNDCWTSNHVINFRRQESCWFRRNVPSPSQAGLIEQQARQAVPFSHKIWHVWA